MVSATKPRFTAKEGQYLAFIYHFTKIHRQPPAEADLRQYFDVSPPAVHDMILALERHGFISRVPSKARSIKLLVSRTELPALA
jgi:repressor LexA